MSVCLRAGDLRLPSRKELQYLFVKDGSIEGVISALIVAWPHFFHNLFAKMPSDQVRDCDVVEFEQASSDHLFTLDLLRALASHLGCCEPCLGEEGPTQYPENMDGTP
jgi:hypothetical protein